MDEVRRVAGSAIVPCPAPLASVTLWLGGGDLAVVACDDEQEARVEVHEVRGPPLAVSCVDGALRVEHREPGEPVWAALRRAVSDLALPWARLAVLVPPGVELTARLATAAVYLEGLTGAVTVTTVSGGVRLRGLSGVSAVTSGAGGVEASCMAGRLAVKTATGAVSVRGERLRSARLATLSGRLELALSDPDCLVTSTSAGGALDVLAPADAGYDLTASAPRGSVHVDGHEVDEPEVPDAGGCDDPGPDGRADDRRTTVHRSEGDRALVIKARTLSGTVSLRRCDI